MRLIERYIFRQFLTAFAVVLGVLTLVVWLTTALRQLEILTGFGQSLSLFLTITMLAIPMLLTYIAPFALFIACVFTLNKLNADSELIVMSASGLTQTRLLRPFMSLSFFVACISWLMTLQVVPGALRELRQFMTNVRADMISTVIQPGKFTTIDKNLTFHVRDRDPSGALLGVFVNDARDDEIENTYISSRGLITKTPEGTFLIMEKGEIIRRPKGKEFGSIISFDRNAFNLDVLVGKSIFTAFSPSERWTGELLNPQNIEGADERFLSRARSELHDRFAIPLYNIAFVFIAFVALGQARTTRQSRNKSVVVAIASVVGLRVAGFGVSGLVQRYEEAVPLVYIVPLTGIIICFFLAQIRLDAVWKKAAEKLFPQRRRFVKWGM